MSRPPGVEMNQAPVDETLPPDEYLPSRRASDRTERWIRFGLNGQDYGVQVLAVMEVLRASEISPVPGAARDVLGVINLRGQIVTVVDLRTRLGLQAREIDTASRVMVLDCAGQPVGLLVDSVAQVVEVSGAQVERSPRINSAPAANCIRGVCRLEGESALMLLDTEKLLRDCLPALQ